MLHRLLGKSDAVYRGNPPEGYKAHFYWIGANGDHALRVGHWKLRLCGEQALLLNTTRTLTLTMTLTLTLRLVRVLALGLGIGIALG